MQNANAVIPKGCKHSLETEPIVKHEAALKYLQVTRINISKLLKSSSDLQRSVFIATEKQLLWNVWKFFLTLDTKISFHQGIELFYFSFLSLYLYLISRCRWRTRLKSQKWRPASQANQIFVFKIKATPRQKRSYLKPTQPELPSECYLRNNTT